MAEGFARRYGSDVMEVVSAGLSPAPIIQPLTHEVMEQKNIKLAGQSPKDLSSVTVADFDLLINMSGVKLPTRIPIEVRDWKVEDPIGRPQDVYLTVRDQIEDLVMRLILELRREARPKASQHLQRSLLRLGRRPR
jgi:protein-tyrosine-phosphatase